MGLSVYEAMRIEIRFIAEDDKDVETLKLLENIKVEVKLGACWPQA
jgi:hypothetical protein